MDEKQRKNVSLQDILNYDVDTYFKPEELAWIRSVFANNPRGVNILRKALLPSVGDMDLPPEEIASDVWLNGIDWSQVMNDEAKALMVGRQLAIKFVMGALIKLKVMANQKVETSMERALREKKNSSQ